MTRDDGETYESAEAAQLGAVGFAIGILREDLVGLKESVEAGEADPPEDPVELEELDLLKEDRKNLEEVLRVLGEEKARLETMLS